MRVPDGEVRQGDTAPPAQVQLLGADGTAPDLTGKTVTCTVRPADGCGGASKTTLDPAQDYIDRKGAYVQHRWLATETARPGLLLVTFNDGMVTYPPGDFFRYQVTPKLG